MKKKFEFDDMQIKKYKDVVIKSGKNTISHLQVRFGISYNNARLVFGILNKDKKLISEILKYQNEKPVIIHKFTELAIKHIRKIKNKDYLDWDKLCQTLGIKYEYQQDIIQNLIKDGYLLNNRVYLIYEKS